MSDIDLLNKFYTVHQVSNLKGLTYEAIIKRIQKGTIQAEKFNGVWIIAKDELHNIEDRIKSGRPKKSKKIKNIKNLEKIY